MNFADVIRPLSVDDFVNHHLGLKYLRVEGAPGRFASLVTWDQLNAVLGSHRLLGRLNLIRQNSQIPSTIYLRDPAGRHASTVVPRVLEQRLRSGDTLLLTAVDELFEPVSEIVASMERLLRVPVNANLYAAFRQLQGFALHWDTHDTLILQIAGTKHWRVFEPTLQNPVSPRRPGHGVRPTGLPVWEGLLKAGDLLYMPRGWWHVAEPVEEASLHVTIGFDMPKGLDYLGWLLERLKDVDGARLNLPVFGAREAKTAFADSLSALVAQHITVNSLDHYLASVQAADDRSFLPSLPAAACDFAVDRTTPLVLTHGRALVFEETGADEVGFWTNGAYWHCAAALREALSCLGESPGYSIDDLTSRVIPEHRPSLRAFLQLLLEAGVLSPMVVGPPRLVMRTGG